MIGKNPRQTDLGELKQTEIDLIYLMRHKFRYGTIEIIVRDGYPVDVSKTVQRVRLGSLSTDDVDKL